MTLRDASETYGNLRNETRTKRNKNETRTQRNKNEAKQERNVRKILQETFLLRFKVRCFTNYRKALGLMVICETKQERNVGEISYSGLKSLVSLFRKLP